MMSGTYKFQICLQFNGTAEVKADSKKQALEALKELKAKLGEVRAFDDRIKDWNIDLLAQAEERI